MRRISGVLAALLVLVAGLRAQTPPAAAPASAQAPAAPGPGRTIVERVIVRVNGEILTQTQFTEQQTDAVRSLPEVQGMTAAPDDATLQRLLNRVTPDAIVQAVNDLLLVQDGRELGGKFTDDDFKSAVDSVKKANNLDDAALKKELDAEGVTMDQLRKNFERAAMRQYAQQEEIFKHMNLTEEELRQYYSTHKDKFMTPETVTLRELAIAIPGRSGAAQTLFSSGDEAAVQAKIDQARTRAASGEDFAALVTEYSTSPTKSSGGLIGPLNTDDLSPLIADAIKSLQPGQVTQPVRTTNAIQIYKLEARTAPVLQDFEKVRRDIEQAIRIDRLGGETDKLLQRLRSEAVIEWKDDTLRQVYEKRLAEQGAK